MDHSSEHEYHQVLAGVGVGEGVVFKPGSPSLVGEGVVASLTVVADDHSISGDVTNEIIITADDSITLSSEMEQTDEAASDTLQSDASDKTLGGQIVFIHQQEEQLGQDQPQLHQGQRHLHHTAGIITVQQQQQSSSHHQVLSVNSSEPQQRQSHAGELVLRTGDLVSSSVLTTTTPSSSSSSSVINGKLGLPANILVNPTTLTTTVEQPNNGPCMCFVCGRQLSDPSERFYYLKTQKLFNTQVTLLELLSDVLNQTVVTNTKAVDLCSRCSELVNETDSAYTHLNRLKKQINSLFTNNQRPKLTFQILPKSSNLHMNANSVAKIYQPG